MTRGVRIAVIVIVVGLVLVLAAWVFFRIVGGLSQAPRNADGAFEGEVTR